MALLRDRTGHPMAALKILSLSLPRRRIPKTMISKIQQAMIDRAVAILVEAHVLFWEKQDYQGYLTLCNEYRFAIQLGTKRIVPLFWIARAYVEGGMLTAGARLYERMLLDFKITPTQRAHLVLQLVRVYASMNKVELMDKALALLDNTPNNPVDLQQYNLAHAVVAVFKKDYPLCVKSIDDTLKVGVSGDNLFQLALQGSLCARKGGDLDKANYFLTMAGLHEGVLLPDNKASSEMISWQTKALFEKINVLVAQKNFALAANIADRLLEQYPDLDIPLETVFAVVTSYREMGLADKAASFWDQYGEQHKGEVPSEFVDEYKKLLDMLTKLELVQR